MFFPRFCAPLMLLGANGVVVVEGTNDCALYDKYMFMSNMHDRWRLESSIVCYTGCINRGCDTALTIEQGRLYDLQNLFCVRRVRSSRDGGCYHLCSHDGGFYRDWLCCGRCRALHNTRFTPASVRAGFTFTRDIIVVREN